MCRAIHAHLFQMVRTDLYCDIIILLNHISHPLREEECSSYCLDQNLTVLIGRKTESTQNRWLF